MKKLFCILLFITPFIGQGQNWSPAGATWYYGFEVWSTAGYYKIEYTGDTIITSITCKKLKKTAYWHDLAFLSSDTAVVGTEYTYADTNKVYIYKHNQFYTLYDFAALPGATWTVPEIKNYAGCDTIGVIKVDSVGTTVINSETLRYICVSLMDTAQKWGWSAKIVEKIGPIKSYSNYDYLFPVKFDYCGMIVDELIEGGRFRCYSDSSSFAYSSNIAPSCDFITSTNDFSYLADDVNVFPNPNLGTFTIDLGLENNVIELRLTNSVGETIVQKQMNHQNRFTFENIPHGTYILSLLNQNGSTTNLKVISCL